MKQTVISCWILILCLTLAACGGPKGQTDFDPEHDVETILNSSAFSEILAKIDQDTACALYGIDETSVRCSAVYGSTGASAEELAIFTFEDGEGVDAALSAFRLRVEDRTEEMRDYLPAELPKLDGAVVERRGNSVLLVIAADYGPIEDFLDI